MPRLHHPSDILILSLAIWLCVLPIAFAIAFIFGLQAGFITSAGLLSVVTALCWFMCSSHLPRLRIDRKHHENE